MSAANLAVCVGPSLLWSDCPAQDLRLVPSLVETLIHHAPAVMSPPQIPSFDTRDSGTDESDCKHFYLSYYCYYIIFDNKFKNVIHFFSPKKR